MMVFGNCHYHHHRHHRHNYHHFIIIRWLRWRRLGICCTASLVRWRYSTSSAKGNDKYIMKCNPCSILCCHWSCSPSPRTGSKRGRGGGDMAMRRGRQRRKCYDKEIPECDLRILKCDLRTKKIWFEDSKRPVSQFLRCLFTCIKFELLILLNRTESGGKGQKRG